jgi:hypothetical protein
MHPVRTIALLGALSFWGCKMRGVDSALAGRTKDSPSERLYKRVFGYAPADPAMIARLAAASDYARGVDAVIDSEDFRRDGFFKLHTNLLAIGLDLQDVLNPGTATSEAPRYDQSARDEATPDYCALKMEVEEAARVDADAKPGSYWNLLSYEQRWLPLPGFMTEGPLAYCYFGTSVSAIASAVAKAKDSGKSLRELVKAADYDRKDAYLKPHVTGAAARAAICAAELLSWNDSAPDAIGSRPPYMAKMLKLFTDASDFRSSAYAMLDHPTGIAFAEEQLNFVYGFHQRPNIKLHFSKRGNILDLRQLVAPQTAGSGGDACRYTSIANAGRLAEPARRRRYETVTRAPLVAWYQMAPSFVFARATIDGDIGLMGSPYWLASVPTSGKNHNLHRSKQIFEAWMCKDISPDTANETNEPPRVPQELVDVFGDDPHATKSRNCFDCHAGIQPVANFFDGLSYGRPYGRLPSNFKISLIDPDLFYFSFNRYGMRDLTHPIDRRTADPSAALGAEFPGEETYFLGADLPIAAKPGGFWQWTGPDKGQFTPIDGKPKVHGLAGLAAMLRTLPQVRTCLARRTWYLLAGDVQSPSAEDIAAFGRTLGDAGFSAAVRQILLSDKVKAAVVDGVVTPRAASPIDALDCSSWNKAGADATLTGVCASCHSDMVYEAGEPFSMTEGLAGTLAWKRVFDKVSSDQMPPKKPADWTAETKRDLLCLAKEGINQVDARLQASHQGVTP